MDKEIRFIDDSTYYLSIKENNNEKSLTFEIGELAEQNNYILVKFSKEDAKKIIDAILSIIE